MSLFLNGFHVKQGPGMIAHLRGRLFEKNPRTIILENQGVGYEITVPLSTFYALPEGGEVALYIHTNVREDAINLFGFITPVEKAVFLLLISVSGIGPKLAVNILSGIGPEELLQAMACGEADRLQAIPGVGKKTAERMTLELKDRSASLLSDLRIGIKPEAVSMPDKDESGIEDAVSALVNLGYPPRSARKAVESARSREGASDLEGLIREALRLLS